VAVEPEVIARDDVLAVPIGGNRIEAQETAEDDRQWLAVLQGSCHGQVIKHKRAVRQIDIPRL
jgi:hypothetical protein